MTLGDRLGQMCSPVNTSCRFSIRFNSLAVVVPPGHLPFQESPATFFTTTLALGSAPGPSIAVPSMRKPPAFSTGALRKTGEKF